MFLPLLLQNMRYTKDATNESGNGTILNFSSVLFAYAETHRYRYQISLKCIIHRRATDDASNRVGGAIDAMTRCPLSTQNNRHFRSTNKIKRPRKKFRRRAGPSQMEFLILLSSAEGLLVHPNHLINLLSCIIIIIRAIKKDINKITSGVCACDH